MGSQRVGHDGVTEHTCNQAGDDGSSDHMAVDMERSIETGELNIGTGVLRRQHFCTRAGFVEGSFSTNQDLGGGWFGDDSSNIIFIVYFISIIITLAALHTIRH